MDKSPDKASSDKQEKKAGKFRKRKQAQERNMLLFRNTELNTIVAFLRDKYKDQE